MYLNSEPGESWTQVYEYEVARAKQSQASNSSAWTLWRHLGALPGSHMVAQGCGTMMGPTVMLSAPEEVAAAPIRGYSPKNSPLNTDFWRKARQVGGGKSQSPHPRASRIPWERKGPRTDILAWHTSGTKRIALPIFWVTVGGGKCLKADKKKLG